jgi:hypothetical protein
MDDQLKEELKNIKTLSDSRESPVVSKVSVKAESNTQEEVVSGMIKRLPISQEDETGYFKELIGSVMEDPDNINKLNHGAKGKFASKDIVSSMKAYWEKQTPDLILHNIGGEAKANLMQQAEKLHALEKEWQNNYVTLLACEDKIRDEEKQLKEALAQFVSLYKRTLNKKRR